MVVKDDCVNCLVKLYNIMREEYNHLCPLIEKEIVFRDNAPWFNTEILRAKKEKKKRERLWRRLKTNEARRAYEEARNRENMLVIRRKREYYQNKVAEAGSNINKLHKILHGLTANKSQQVTRWILG